MATVKLATLAIRTIAKPISAQIKNQAKQHERFRGLCVSLAQSMHRGEILLRTNILGEPARHNVRPLSEARAIENGANTLAEGFLFGVAALLIVGEAWRSSRSQSKRRDSVDDQLEELSTKLQELTTRVNTFGEQYDDRLQEEKLRTPLQRMRRLHHSQTKIASTRNQLPLPAHNVIKPYNSTQYNLSDDMLQPMGCFYKKKDVKCQENTYH